MHQKKLSTQALIVRVLRFATPFRKTIAIVFLLILLTTILTAISTWLMSKIFDLVQKQGIQSSLPEAYLLLGSAFGVVMISFVVNYFKDREEDKNLSVSISNYLDNESLSKFFSFSAGQHINEHSAVKQSIVNRGIGSIKNQINQLVFQWIPQVTQVLVALGVLFSVHVVIGIIFVALAAIIVFVRYRFNVVLTPKIRKLREQTTQSARFTAELYRLVTFIQFEGREKRSLGELHAMQEKHRTSFLQTWLPQNKKSYALGLITSTIRFFTLFLMVHFLSEKEVTAGQFFLMYTWSGSVTHGLTQLMAMNRSFMQDKINIEKYLDLLETKPETFEVENPICPEYFFGQIEFRNVSFWYPNRVGSYDQETEKLEQPEPVLKDVSFTICGGQKIGVVGQSGSGKSTLMHLLLRGSLPQKGQILIDGNDIRLLDKEQYYRHIGNVPQQVELFDQSLRYNILFGLEDQSQVSDERLQAIARTAGIEPFFSRLEHGFDTMVGEKGVRLSGGERQRVGIARALAKNPSILIFDEATSALDSMSERLVQESIDEAAKGKTAIIIAHRLSTVKNCDKILVFRHGILLAEGTHEELLNTCEYYSELVHHQMIALS